MKKQKHLFIVAIIMIIALLSSCNQAETITCGACGASIPSDAMFCSKCGANLAADTTLASEVTQATENTAPSHVHAWSEWTTTIEATCTAEGNQERSCSCGKKETQSISALGHTEVIDAAVPATCEAIGKTEGKHCSVCNTIIVPQSTIASLKHNYTNGKCTMCGIMAESKGLNFTLNNDGKSYSVDRGTCTDKEIFIPAVHNDLPVTNIGEGAFSCCSVTSIYIPDTITSIGNFAFESSNLSSIAIPNGVKNIGRRTFFDCINLTSITIPDSVTSIGSEAFSQCYNLSSVTIGNNVTIIDDNAFYYCKSLSNINIPDSVTRIGHYAFAFCSNLTKVIIPSGVSNMGNSVFRGCESLTSVNIPDGLMSIPHSAFSGCTSLTSIIIPDGIISIDLYAFDGCKNLESITIPNSIVSIGQNAFDACSNLKSISIGKGLTSIEGNPFTNCANLTSITVDKDNAVYHSQDNCLIETATKTMVAGCQTSIIPSDGSVTIIGQTAFMDCSTITNINIPDSVKTIGSQAFDGCSNLTNILIGTGVTNIGTQIFRNCDNLKDITVKNGNRRYHSNGNCLIETAKKSLIAGCPTSVIPSDGSVTTIKEYAFFNCNSLRSISIPNGVTSIEYWAFGDCSNLTSVTIPSSITDIESGAFHGCIALKDIYFDGTKADWYNLIKNTSLENINVTIHYDD